MFAQVLALLTAKEDDVATTLLMLPFACQDFEVCTVQDPHNTWQQITIPLNRAQLHLIDLTLSSTKDQSQEFNMLFTAYLDALIVLC